ncbi:helix-turn-helix domain-containing protein [Fictibacillus enclensis]|uniref:helix-turn-helix domain-containing protein n=1 Tax=Fictibacillus enclensis TaxID=1017270 RepID=UPI0024C088CA|nr:helix-turn-helix transcriptional regulator [Fictibacillus enclensis]WHY73445.1 helix-turn-helix transcriptional regulator [Fictibacillus enclensis]
MANEMFKHCRLYKNMSQEEFSEFTGISRPVIARIEAGDLKVSSRVKAKLLSVFEMSDDFLKFHEQMVISY